MNKKILIGSIIAVVILILMPTVPAIHINAIENQIKAEYEELPLIDVINFKIPDKFPLLYLLVVGIGIFRLMRALMLLMYSIEYDEWGGFKISNPFLLLRGIILTASVDLWTYGWEIISEILGWDWEFGLDG